MALPKLKDIKWVTTDCYGTLIDWEKGILDAFTKEADRDGFSFDEQKFIDRFLEVQAEIMSGSYELYAEVLRRTAVKVAGEIGWELEPSRAQFLPDSVARWVPFREANAAMDRLGKRYDIGIVSNIDDKLLGVSRRHLRTELDLVVTAQQVRSYKPDPAHFKEGARRIGGKKGWVHIASGYEADVAPLMKMNVPVIWVNRRGEKLEGRKKPDAEVQELPRRGEEARCRRLSRPHPSGPTAAHWLPPRGRRAMVARARERFAAERRHLDRRRRQAERHGALPNLIVIGGLKCGTTSLHHYLNLHPEIAMSRPKELNFFVAELNWELGADWYASHFDRGAAGPRRELAPLHQPAAVRGRRRADARAARRRRPGRLHGPRPDRPDALPLPAQRRRRLRDTAAGGGARRPGLRLRRPQPLRDAGRALPARPSARSGC